MSPLLANVYLHKLDQWIIREWEEKTTKHQYTRKNSKIRGLRKTNLKPAYLVRYADDWILITDSKANAEKWKRRIEKYLDTKLKLKLSPNKTLITNIRKSPIHFLGFRYKQIPGKSKTGWITCTRPDDNRLKAKINELRKQTKQLRKYNGKQLIHQIITLNSAITGIGNYYKPATMVNIELNKYADSLLYTASKALKPKGAHWTPANKVNNLINRHTGYITKIPAIKYNELTIGVTSLGFIKWEKAHLKNPIETPYTPEGRKAYYERTSKKQPLPRDDITMNLTLSELIAKGLADPKYNFEYLMNRAYAFNRDKGKCKVCGNPIIGYELETHHINPDLPLNQINKVPNLASTHKWCHNLIHSTKDVSHLVDKKTHKRILKLREKLNQKPEIA
ncbi:reverse transcriptase domain-containing protein [Desulfallas sp. Bu1-1]|uniref:group II intron reverse transcriptase n=1 Tax=Desulfallas sp. Bu1-1 TaxID=2787620 RepID=UPI0028BE7646|nr:reverse transcriptase domain-containing protein [Desulfallas sp. Bu1-1]